MAPFLIFILQPSAFIRSSVLLSSNFTRINVNNAL